MYPEYIPYHWLVGFMVCVTPLCSIPFLFSNPLSNLGTSNGQLIYRYAASRNTQHDEGHQYMQSTQDRGRVFILSGQDDGLGATGVGGRGKCMGL